jgi:hypothetical protein
MSDVANTEVEILSARLDRLRVLYTLLSSPRDSQRQDELIEATRVAIAGVRESRARLAERAEARATISRRRPSSCDRHPAMGG